MKKSSGENILVRDYSRRKIIVDNFQFSLEEHDERLVVENFLKC